MTSMFRSRLRRLVWFLLAGMVVATVAVLVLRSQYRRTVVRAQEHALRAALVQMRDAIDRYVTSNGRCPDSLRALADDRYIRTVPIDPMTKSPNTWRFTKASTGCDVKSGAAELASNGRRYTDW